MRGGLTCGLCVDVRFHIRAVGVVFIQICLGLIGQGNGDVNDGGLSSSNGNGAGSSAVHLEGNLRVNRGCAAIKECSVRVLREHIRAELVGFTALGNIGHGKAEAVDTGFFGVISQFRFDLTIRSGSGGIASHQNICSGIHGIADIGKAGALLHGRVNIAAGCYHGSSGRHQQRLCQCAVSQTIFGQAAQIEGATQPGIGGGIQRRNPGSSAQQPQNTAGQFPDRQAVLLNVALQHRSHAGNLRRGHRGAAHQLVLIRATGQAASGIIGTGY